MNIFDTADNLLKELAGFGFLQLFAFDNVVEKFSATGVLHNQEELS